MTTITIYTTTTAPLATDPTNERVITATFRQPARSAHVVIDCTLLNEALETVPSQFRPIVEASLMTAAKDILSDYVKGFSVGVMPTEVDPGMFSYPAILDRANNAGIQWLSKEEITEQWKASATYQAWIADSRFKTNPKFAKVVNYYGDLITKLAGKTSSYKDSDLDLMLAKLKEEDLSTQLGAFVVRRIEALKAKPQAEELDADLL
jgi:hypothetical protein